MLRKIYGFLGIESAASRRHKLVCRLWYVHNKDLSEAFQSDFYEAIVEAKMATVMTQDKENIPCNIDNKRLGRIFTSFSIVF